MIDAGGNEIFWETKSILIKGVDTNELDKLDHKITEHCVHGWEPWSFIKGGTTWLVSYKRPRRRATDPAEI